MPTRVWPDLTAWLSEDILTSCVALAEALHTVSHDRLTRLMHAAWAGPTLRDRTGRTWFVWEQSALIRAATVIPSLCDGHREPGLGLFQPGTQAGGRPLPRLADLDPGQCAPPGGLCLKYPFCD
jgi:hypothetical protein